MRLPYDSRSVSVSVSVSSPPVTRDKRREAGLALRLNSRIVSSPPCSFDGKWTFLGFAAGREGVVGAERAR
jgi:hypothetical protein